MTVRTSILGSGKDQLLEWLQKSSTPSGLVAERFQEGVTIRGHANATWNGVSCLQLVKLIYDWVSRGFSWVGVRHIFSPRPISKLELLRMLARIYGIKVTFEAAATPVLDRTLGSMYRPQAVPELEVQLQEQRDWDLQLSIPG